MNKLILLHGALGASEQFIHLKNTLEKNYEIHILDFYGHGQQDFFSSEFSIPVFAKQTIEYLDKNKIDRIHIFGYSMGGYVALYLAKHYPERVLKIMTLATKFNWTPESAAAETKMLNPEIIEAKVPDFAKQLKERHGGEKWKKLLQHTAEMMMNMGNKNTLSIDEFKSIEHTVLIGLGDRDKMVSFEESHKVFQLIKNSGFYVLPHTKHPFESVDTKRLATKITSFIQ